MSVLAKKQRALAAGTAILLIGGTSYLTANFGPAPLFIVGVPASVAYLLWFATYLKDPPEHRVALPLFLLTTAGFAVHAIEEHLGRYGPAVGRIFGFAWTESAFMVIALALLGTLGLVAIGLYYRVSIAGLVAMVFLTTRIAEIALFVFPFLPPAIQPSEPDPVSQAVSGTFVENMPNHYAPTTDSYYFPGMLTIALPVVPATIALYRIWKARPRTSSIGSSTAAHLARIRSR